ncbi:hypothetical protein SDRG_12446 [Saprolegnia diclina VS20]|uniref:HECT domain-containing protein n=1 Tax=Saprolegnia diclina (strain VS20) TaxID=1156394 RepID=T0RJ31_SAPDV|nr:hypothetical protein SDRG_12446 [Saprolegnia diclina VS20]EQC29902.1 hypothetical protein SDRG_12446 [Saprolegnia diclina VS20]|eukprot:XP_008616741.1 hypothetical protein SDRG_12446 [Saprolegnia diclina VS20]
MEVDRGKTKLKELIQDVHAACGEGLYQSCLSRRSMACCFLRETADMDTASTSVLDKRILDLVAADIKPTAEGADVEPSAELLKDDSLDVDLTEPLVILKNAEPVLYQAVSGFLRQSKTKGHVTKEELLFLELLVLLKASLLLPKSTSEAKARDLADRVRTALAALEDSTAQLNLHELRDKARSDIRTENDAYKRLQWVPLDGAASAAITIDDDNTLHATPSLSESTTLAAVACVVTRGPFRYTLSTTTAIETGLRVGWMAPGRRCHTVGLGDDMESIGFDGRHIYRDGAIVATSTEASSAWSSLTVVIDGTTGVVSFSTPLATTTAVVAPLTAWTPALSVGHRGFQSLLSTPRSSVYASVWQQLGFQPPVPTVEATAVGGVPLLPAPCTEFYPEMGTSVRVGRSVQLSPSAWTLSFFIYPLPLQDGSEPRPWRTICLKGQDASMQRTPSVFLSCDRLLLAVCVSTASDWNSTVVSSAPLATHRWTHVAIVCDDLTLRLVLNGKEDRSLTLADKVLHNTHPFHFGKTPVGVKKATTDYKGFRGYLHHVQLHETKALSVKELSKFVASKKASLEALHVSRESTVVGTAPSNALRLETTYAPQPALDVAYAPSTGGPLLVPARLFQACPKWPHAFHCEAIVRYTHHPQFQVVLGCLESAGPSYLFVLGVTPTGRLCLRSRERKFATAQRYLCDNTVHKIGLSFTTDRVVFYVDGVAVERVVSSGASLDPNGLSLSLAFVVGGAPSVPSFAPWQGDVRLVRVLASPPCEKQPPRDVARYAFVQGRGTIVHDTTGRVPLWHGSLASDAGWTTQPDAAGHGIVTTTTTAIPETNLPGQILAALEPRAAATIASLRVKHLSLALGAVDVVSSVVWPHVLTFLLLHSVLAQWMQEKDLLDGPQVFGLLRVLRANFAPLSSHSSTSLGLPPASVGLGMQTSSSSSSSSFAERLRDMLLRCETVDWYDDDMNDAVRAEAILAQTAGLEVFCPTPLARAELLLRLLTCVDAPALRLDTLCDTLTSTPHLLAQWMPASDAPSSSSLLFPWALDAVKRSLLDTSDDNIPLITKAEVISVLEKLPRMPSLDATSPAEQLVVLYEEWQRFYVASTLAVPIETTKTILKALLTASTHGTSSARSLLVSLQDRLLADLRRHWTPCTVSRLLQWHDDTRFFKVVNCPIGVRETPNVKAPKTGRTLSIGQLIETKNVLQYPNDSVQYVELLTGGWVFDVDPTDGMLLLDEHAANNAQLTQRAYSLTALLDGQAKATASPLGGHLRFEGASDEKLQVLADGLSVTNTMGGAWRTALGSKTFTRGSGVHTWQVTVTQVQNIGQLFLGIASTAPSSSTARSYVGSDPSSYGWQLTGDWYHVGVRTKSAHLPFLGAAPIVLDMKLDSTAGTLLVVNTASNAPVGPALVLDLVAGEAYAPAVSLCNAHDSIAFSTSVVPLGGEAITVDGRNAPPSLEPTPLAAFYAKTLLAACKPAPARQALSSLLTPVVASMLCWSNVDDEPFVLDTIDEILLQEPSSMSSSDESDARLLLAGLGGHLYGQLIGASPETHIDEADARWLRSPLFQAGLSSSKPSTSAFFKQLMDGLHPAFDKWVLKFANASPLVVRMGGASLEKAIRAVLGCMLYHCGMSSYAEFEDKAAGTKTSPAPKPLRSLWQKAYELKAYALRLKNSHGLSYDEIAATLLAKVDFLLHLSPTKADDGIGVYYHELPTLVRKISMGKRSSSFDADETPDASLRDVDAEIIASIAAFCRSDCNLKKLSEHLQSAQAMALQRAHGLRRVTKLVSALRLPCKAAILLQVVAAIRAVDVWHYSSGISGCPYALQHDVRCAFEGYYNALVRHLSVATTQPTSWQLLLLDALGVRILPDDHALVAAGRVFHVLQELLDVGRADVRQATMKVVYLLAVQVASEGDGNPNQALAPSHVLTPPHFKRQLSGPQTLSSAVFDMLYNELSLVVCRLLESHKTSRTTYALDVLGENPSLLGILSLLQFVSSSPACNASLATTPWLSIFVTIACFGVTEPQVRSMQLLSTLLPVCNPVVVTLELPFTLEGLVATPSSVRGAADLVRFLVRAVGAPLHAPPSETLPRSSRSALSLASESVSLLRVLLAEAAWHPLVLEISQSMFRSDDVTLQIGVLGVLGSFVEPIRYGGYAILPQHDGMVMLLDPTCDLGSATVLCDHASTPVSTAEMTTVPKHTLSLTILSDAFVDAILESTANALLAPMPSDALFLHLLHVAHRLFCEHPTQLFDIVAKSPVIARKVFELGGLLSTSSGLPSLPLVEAKFEMLQALQYNQVYGSVRDGLYPLPAFSEAPPPTPTDDVAVTVCNVAFDDGLLCTLKQVSTFDTPVGIGSDAIQWLEALLNHMLFKTVESLLSVWTTIERSAATRLDAQTAVETVYREIALPEMLQAACAEANEWLSNRDHWGVEWGVHETRIVDYVVAQLEMAMPGTGAAWRDTCNALQLGPYLCATCECLAADVLSLAIEVSRRHEQDPPLISLAFVLQAMHDDEELHRLLEYHEAFLRSGPTPLHRDQRSSADRVLDVRLQSMMTMGFPEAWCKRALEESNHEVNTALNWILSNGHLLDAPTNDAMTTLVTPETPGTPGTPREPAPNLECEPIDDIGSRHVLTDATTVDVSGSAYTALWALTNALSTVVTFSVQATSDVTLGLFASLDEAAVHEVVLGAKHNTLLEVYDIAAGSSEKRLLASDTGAFCDPSYAVPYWLVVTRTRVHLGYGHVVARASMLLEWAAPRLSHVSFATLGQPAVVSAIQLRAHVDDGLASSGIEAALARRHCIRPLDDPEQLSDMTFCFHDETPSSSNYEREHVFHPWAPASSRVGFAERAAKFSADELASDVLATSTTLRVLYARRLGVGVLAACKDDIPVLLDVFDGHEDLFVPFVSLVAHRAWVSDFATAPTRSPLGTTRLTTPELLRPTVRALCATANPLRSAITAFLGDQMDRFLRDGHQGTLSWRHAHSDKLDAYFGNDADLRFLGLLTSWLLESDEAIALTPTSVAYDLYFIWVKALQASHLEVQQKALQVLGRMLLRALNDTTVSSDVRVALRRALSVTYLEENVRRLLAFEDEVYPLYSRYFQAHMELVSVLQRFPAPATPIMRYALRFKGGCSYVGLATDDLLPPWTAQYCLSPERGGAKAILASSTNGCIALRSVEHAGVSVVSYREPSSTTAFETMVPYDTWSVLSLVASPTQVTLYLNGVRVATQAVTGFALPMQFIGHDMYGVRGRIANVRYFNAALGDAHIAALSALDLHQCSSVGDDAVSSAKTTDDLVPALTIAGHWPLQEGAGAHVYDVSEHLNESAIVGASWTCAPSHTIVPPKVLSLPTSNVVFSGAGTWTRDACAALGGPWSQSRSMAFFLELYATSSTSSLSSYVVMGRLILNARITCIVCGQATQDGELSFAIESLRQDIKETYSPLEWMAHMRFSGRHRAGQLIGAWTTTLAQTVVTSLPTAMSFLPSCSDAIEVFDGGRRVQSLLRKGKKRAGLVFCAFGVDAMTKHWHASPSPDLSLDQQLFVQNRTDTFITVRVHGLVTHGKVYYELVLQSKGLMQLGWASPGFRPAFTTHGVGDHFGSFGVDGKRRKKWCNTGHAYGSESWSWTNGDVLGVLLDMDAREMRFTHNGVDLGLAFAEADYAQVPWSAGLYPAGSFSSGQGAKINVGHTPFQFAPPPGFVAVASVVDVSHVDVFNHRTKQFAPVCAHHRVTSRVAPPPPSLARGSIHWEVEITALQATDGLRVGIATPSADPNGLLGGDAYGWGFCATGKTYHAGHSQRLASTGFAQGDVVGLELNMDLGTLVVYRNGLLLGTAFSNLHLSLPMQCFVNGTNGFVPCISVYRPQTSVFVRGLKHGRGELRYPPSHSHERFLGHWAHGRRHGLGQLTLREKEGYYLGHWVANHLEGVPAFVAPHPLCVSTLYPSVWKTLRFQRAVDHPTQTTRTQRFLKGKVVSEDVTDADVAAEPLPSALPVIDLLADATAPWYPSVASTLGYVTSTMDVVQTSTQDVELCGVWEAHTEQAFTLVPPPSAYDMIAMSQDLMGVRLEAHASTGTHLLVRGNTAYTSGVHYWEVAIEACNHGSVFLGVAAPSVLSPPDGWGDYGFVSYRVKWSQAEGEQLYGRYFSAGDVVGIRLDMDKGTLAFLKDGDDFVRGRPAVVDMGVAFRFLKSQAGRKACAFGPAFGLSYPGDALSVRRTKGLHHPTLRLSDRLHHALEAARLVQDLASTQLLDATVWTRAQAMHASMTSTGFFQPRVHLTRAGTPLRVSAAMRDAALVTTRGQATLSTRYGTAQILGQIDGRVWFLIEGEEGAGAWYWRLPEVLALLDQAPMEQEAAWSCDACTMLNDPNLSKCQICETPRTTTVPDDVPPPSDADVQATADPFVVYSTTPDPLWPLATPVAPLTPAFEALVDGSSSWTRQHDVMLVAHVDALCDAQATEPENLAWADVWEHARGTFSGFDASLVAARLACLLVVNGTVAQLLPFVDLHGHDLFALPTAATAAALTTLRDVLFKRIKIAFWRDLLAITTTHTTPPSDEYDRPEGLREVSLNRIQALEPHGVYDKTIFGQLATAMTNWDASSLRRAYTDELQDAGQPRAFYVKCLGEGVDDHGGPYRAVFQTAGWEEPIGPVLRLFEPCPNAVQASGANQDKYVVSPGASPSHLKFLGRLLGLAMRHRILIPLNCSELFWKPLVSLPLDRKDWSGVDTMVVRELHDLERLSDEEVAGLETHEIIDHLLRVAQAPLAPRDDMSLTSATLIEMVDACVAHRLAAQTAQLRPLMEGFATVVPHAALSLFTPTQLEELVCGSPEIDVELLQRITVYDGVDPNDAHIQFFWQCLTDMNHEQRSSFVNFVLARSRLPRSLEEFTLHFKIQAAVVAEHANPDMYLPHSQTCFFSLSLPRYSSKAICMEKLLYAISHSPTMDADFIDRATTGWEHVAT